MVRDSNPRTSCPVSGFQDRRIRPLCQPSETCLYSAGLSNLRFCSLVAPVGAAHHSFALGIADACLANSYARPSHSTAATNHPKLIYIPPVFQTCALGNYILFFCQRKCKITQTRKFFYHFRKNSFIIGV